MQTANKLFATLIKESIWHNNWKGGFENWDSEWVIIEPTSQFAHGWLTCKRKRESASGFISTIKVLQLEVFYCNNGNKTVAILL